MNYRERMEVMEDIDLNSFSTWQGEKEGGVHGESLLELWVEAGLEWQEYCKGII